MSTKVFQGAAIAAISTTSRLRVAQSSLIAAISILPPNSNLMIFQGAVIAAVRPYEVIRVTKTYPVTLYQPICGCFPVPLFRYEGKLK